MVQIRPGMFAGLVVNVMLAALAVGAAQERPRPIVEAVVADAAFIDEVWDHFFLVGAGMRSYITPRLALGGELSHMRGHGETSNQTFAGTLAFDLRQAGRRITPYVMVTGGAIRQRTLVGTGPGGPLILQPFVSWEGTVAGGVGARVRIGSRLFIAPEFQFGWAPTTRLAIKIGIN